MRKTVDFYCPDCGVLRKVRENRVASMTTERCQPCMMRHKFGMAALQDRVNTKSRLYKTWSGMRTRCGHKMGASEQHKRLYRDKGIVVCPAWRNNFSEFKKWAMANGYADNLTIDRIDSSGNYEPQNCRWVDAKTNSRNRDAVLSVGDVQHIKALIVQGQSKDRIAAEFKKHRQTIFNIANGASWSDIVPLQG